MTIIGISGLIGSGKSTVANILLEEHNFIKLSFADSLKDSVSTIFGWPRNLLEGDTVESRIWREQADEWWSNRLNIFELTPRWVLQQWGTEVCRQGFHDDIWMASLEHKINSYKGKNIVIPDTRFPNEIAMIQKMGGEVWQVKRGENPKWFKDYIELDIKPKYAHESEWAWAKSKFDHIINNDGTLNELKQKINLMIKG